MANTHIIRNIFVFLPSVKSNPETELWQATQTLTLLISVTTRPIMQACWRSLLQKLCSISSTNVVGLVRETCRALPEPKTKISVMEQIERIKQMECCLDRASQAVIRLSSALDEYAEAQVAIRQLSDYYGSDLWKQDFADDSIGLLPQDLKRGVLSEDAVWNLLEDVRNLKERMTDLLT